MPKIIKFVRYIHLLQAKMQTGPGFLAHPVYRYSLTTMSPLQEDLLDELTSFYMIILTLILIYNE